LLEPATRPAASAPALVVTRHMQKAGPKLSLDTMPTMHYQLVSLREQGLSIHAIGKLTGVSYQTVLNHLRRLRLYKSFKIRHLEKCRDQVVALRKQHLTCAAIAQQIGICTDTVVRILKAQGPLRPLHAKPRDLTGERFGKLVVVRQLNSKRCNCVCDCGKRKNVYRPSLKNGCIRSCGCLRREWRLRLRGARPRLMFPFSQSQCAER